MSVALQSVVVALIVVAATLYASRHLWRSARGEGGCGACEGCGSDAARCDALDGVFRDLEQRRR